MSVAALLPPPPAPPHDPLWVALGGYGSWRLAAGGALAIDPADNMLGLAPLPGTAPVLGAASGNLGGLVPPGHVAIDGGGRLWLLDCAGARLRRFDRCACAFVDVPCGQLALGDARAIAADGDRLYIVDAAPPGRVLVVDARTMALHAILRPPASRLPWRPVAVAAWRNRIAVADAGNGRIHLFAGWGGWQTAWDGTGAPSRIVYDGHGRLFAVTAGSEAASIYDAAGRIVAQPTMPADVACGFPPVPFTSNAGGAIDLSGWCDTAGWLGPSGAPIAPPPPDWPHFPGNATAVTVALDSRIERCQWHRAVVDATVPDHAAVRLATTTAEVALDDAAIAALPDSVWAPVPIGGDGTGEALIMSPPGRYAWLRITLTAGGDAVPRVRCIDLEYPRISLRRFLPAAFGADAPSAAFADRLLAIFDTGLRRIETAIDGQAALFDPRSAPSLPGRDVLSWLASWIGVTFDRRWPVARRREYLRAAARLFACRGTATGLRGALLLWLGWSRLEAILPRRAACAPACDPPAPVPPLPPLILEHWKLRRWLFLGQGRLGDAAVLWGNRLLGRSQLDRGAEAGVTRLDSIRDPLRDPFHAEAHAISVFLPSRAVATAAGRGAAGRLLAENKPAHVAARIVAVHPRMRIGIQASLGFDAVVGCWPRGVVLGEGTLGRGTILPDALGRGVASPRIGRDVRLKPSPNTTREMRP